VIPLRDESHFRYFPVLTIVIIVANVAVFVYQRYFGPQGFEGYVFAYGLIPSALTGELATSNLLVPTSPPYTVLSSIFMHGGIMHLLSNMWFLWIFGDNIEAVMGPKRFIFFYLLCGVLASLAHVAIHPASNYPLVGASGAIAGILGAYFLLFPSNRILTLIPIGFFITTAKIPAFLFLGIWFLMQFVYSLMGGNIAWWAHIGGFVSGVVLILFFRKRKKI